MRRFTLEKSGKRPMRSGLASLALVGLCAGYSLILASPALAQTTDPAPTPPPPATDPPATPTPTATPAPTATPTPTTTTKGKDDKKKQTTTSKSKNPITLAKPEDTDAEDPDTQYAPKREIPLAERLLGRLGRGLNITGGLSTRVQNNAVSGNIGGTDRFNEQNVNNNWDYRSVGAFQQRAEMTIQGRAFNAWDVNATLTNVRGGSRFDQIFRFEYDNKGGTKLGLGFLNAGLPGNEFVTFNRSLEGLMVSRDFGHSKIRAKAIASMTRAVTRRGTIRGNNSIGPYFMNAGNIVPGTEKVRINGEDKKSGEDYQINYLEGTITFRDGLIVTEADTIEFTYESETYNTTPGILAGTRWDFTDPRGNSYGITYLQQKSTGGGSRNGEVTERFPVRQDPRYHYQLSSIIDKTQPVVIRWFNRILVENVDYFLNRDLRYFQLLTSALPPDTSVTGTASLQVTYKPVRQTSVTGDRSVLGLDSQMKLPMGGTLGLQLGQSDGVDASQKGMAMSVKTSWQSKGNGTNNRWRASVGWRDMDDTFSTIDSTAGAFLQAEQGMFGDFGFAPNKYIDLTSSFNRSRVANRDYSSLGSTSTTTWANQTSFRTAATLNLPKMPGITLSHNQTEQSGTNSTRSSFSSTNLDANWKLTERFSVRGGLSRTASQGRSVFSSAYNNNVSGSNSTTGSTIIDQLQDSNNSQTNGTTSNNARLSMSYIPIEWLSLSTEFGLSRSTSGTASNGTATSGAASNARSFGFNFSATPFQRLQKHWLQSLSLTGGFSDSSNGQSTANFYNPSNTGNNSIIPTNVSGQRNKMTSFGLRYAPSDRFSLDFSNTQTLALIPGYDNTENGSMSLGLTFIPASWLNNTVVYTTSKTTFVGGQGDSDSRSFILSNNIGPFGRIQLNSVLSLTKYNSATYLGSSGSSNRQATIPNIGGGTTGLLQNGTNTVLTLKGDYMFSRNRSVVLQWTSIDQYSPLNNTQGSTGYYSATNFKQGIGTIGLDFKLAELPGMNTSFGINLNFINLKDRDNDAYSYKARTISADINTRF